MRRIIATVSFGTFTFDVHRRLRLGRYSLPKHRQHRPQYREVVAAAIGIVAAVGVTTAVVIEVEHSHHNIKGCIFSSPDGLEIEDSGTHKRFMLTGATSDRKEGNLVRIHGQRAKKQKDSKTDQVFVVQKLNKTYGACTVTPPTAKAMMSKS